MSDPTSPATEDDEIDLPDGQVLEDIARDLAPLDAVRRLSEALGGVQWFSRIGDRMPADVRSLADYYVSSLGFPDASVMVLRSFDDAAIAAETGDMDSAGWEAEEQCRAGLTAEALMLIDEEALTIALTTLAQGVGDSVRMRVDEMAEIWGVDDPDLLSAMAGAAAGAAHGLGLLVATQSALLEAGAEEEAADLKDHPFATRFALFAAGRWPIGLTGMTFHIF